VNLGDLRAQFRSDAFDQSEPPGFADADVHGWLNEAEEEACLRKDLLLETVDADLCQIEVTSGTRAYDLAEGVIRIRHATWTPEDGEAQPLTIIDRTELDRILPNWRTAEEEPRYLIVTDKQVELGCMDTPTDGTIDMEVWRLPAEAMEADEDSPEIARPHHRHLVHWAVHRALSRPDGELQNDDMAKAALEKFERYFGPAPDADRFRHAEERPHAVKAWI
jgi:hypothetical protein